MRPPSAAFGHLFPRNDRGLIPNRRLQPRQSATTGHAEPIGSRDWPVAMRVRNAVQKLKTGTTDRDGVANEAPLSPVWRVSKFAEPEGQPHASTRARLQMGAPLARQPTPSSPK